MIVSSTHWSPTDRRLFVPGTRSTIDSRERQSFRTQTGYVSPKYFRDVQKMMFWCWYPLYHETQRYKNSVVHVLHNRLELPISPYNRHVISFSYFISSESLFMTPCEDEVRYWCLKVNKYPASERTLSTLFLYCPRFSQKLLILSVKYKVVRWLNVCSGNECNKKDVLYRDRE